MATRIVVAIALGAVVGVEREASAQPAGLRTHITVAAGAALFGVISTHGFDEFVAERAGTNVQIDVTRVASQVVVGVGFLGAGLIFHRGGTVHNLTTAASVWVVAAIGLAAGVGYFGPAVATTVALTASLVALRPARDWVRRRFSGQEAHLEMLLAPGSDHRAVVAVLRSLPDLEVRQVALGKLDGATALTADVVARPGADMGESLAPLVELPAIRSLSHKAGS